MRAKPPEMPSYRKLRRAGLSHETVVESPAQPAPDSPRGPTSNQTAASPIVAFFDDEGRANRALNKLREAGFSPANVGVAHSTSHTAANRAANPGEDPWQSVRSFFHGHPDNIPGARELRVGEVSTAPSASYSHNDLHSSLRNLGLDEQRARYFSGRLHSGGYGALVTVNPAERAGIAEYILRDQGGDLGGTSPESADYSSPSGEYTTSRNAVLQPIREQPVAVPRPSRHRDLPPAEEQHPSSAVAPARTSQPIETAPSTKPAQVISPDPVAASTPRPAPDQTGDMQNIQLLGEVLRVHKQKIDRGEVTVRKEVVTETRTIEVPVQREELVIEQHGAADRQSANASGQQIRIPLNEETASVDKRTVVVEDVAVGKKQVQEIRDLTGEVKHEELVVENRTKRV